ncbi:extracellular solute-binding protein [Phycicoccus duodecadis]|uniref:Carbohydrate ABC transporter substrate-binding protein (CUT1 family) n=1 Tax=Phycicoccus duodecadis TaxID=173053 RepID=A0A2N3YJI0_9MICO|nr:extracellular solute-binding protein [Phycicoccus duodecadis]PKW26979.1 carbohydrate ABC transporter substrate-binding protein (CUT1 family) [Phycicoccus duodecadis]
MRRRPTTHLIAAGMLGALALTACTPGSTTGTGATDQPSGAVETDPAAMGKVTLTVWDQEVRGGQAAQIEELNKEFQAKYPNITLKRVTRSFDDLKTTLGLALSGNNPPDVFQANNGRPDMGKFVQAGQLLPLDRYAEAYRWTERYPESVRKYSSYSSDGKTFGTGNLYGLPQVGEVVGIYANKAVLAKAGITDMPTTWADFEASLAKVKTAGQLPLVLGNLDKWPAIHVFGTVQAQTTPAEEIRTLGFGQKGGSWTTPENQKAAQTLVDWVDKGYFSPDVNGLGYDPAWQQFSKGTGAYLIAGTWLQADLGKAMGDDVTFVLPPPAGSTPVATGGTGIPWAVSSRTKHPDAAAAYIDFITDEHAMAVLAKTENLPVADTADQKAPSALGQDVFTAFGTAVKDDSLVPYLDYATPTMSDTLGAALQDLLAKKATPQQFLDTVQKDYGDFVAQNG